MHECAIFLLVPEGIGAPGTGVTGGCEVWCTLPFSVVEKKALWFHLRGTWMYLTWFNDEIFLLSGYFWTISWVVVVLSPGGWVSHFWEPNLAHTALETFFLLRSWFFSCRFSARRKLGRITFLASGVVVGTGRASSSESQGTSGAQPIPLHPSFHCDIQCSWLPVRE